MLSPLKRDTLLEHARGLRIDITSRNEAVILVQGRRIEAGPQGLAILAAFGQPATLDAALAGFASHGAQRWIDASSTVVHLYRNGVLMQAGSAQAGAEPDAAGFGDATAHVALLNDRIRTERFLAGIAEVVQPGDIVVDIGTGSGVLAIAAARAGAEHVYAIEAGAAGPVARQVFAANGLADRITLIQGWSTEVELPRRADVLVSELIGRDPWDERLLEVTLDARKRLLKPGARMLPGRIRVFGLPVTAPLSEVGKVAATSERIECWRAWYGIDFSPLAEMSRGAAHAQMHRLSCRARTWPRLSEPILLADVDLSQNQDISIDRTIHATAATSGELNALLVYFEADLGSTTLSTHPEQSDDGNNWASPVHLLRTPRSLAAGDPFSIRYQSGIGDGVSRLWLSE